MNKRLQSYMTQIFLVWLTLFAVLAVVTVRSMEWERTKPVPVPSLPVEVNEPPAIPEPQPEPDPWQLLATGRAQGRGTLGKPVVAYHEDKKEVTVTIPYTGTLGQYTSFSFEGGAHGECFDLHGVWRGQTGSHPSTDSHAPVVVVQVGQHGNFMRFSLIGATGTREVRHTADEVILVLKGATRDHGKTQSKPERRPDAAPATTGPDTGAALAGKADTSAANATQTDPVGSRSAGTGSTTSTVRPDTTTASAADANVSDTSEAGPRQAPQNPNSAKSGMN